MEYQELTLCPEIKKAAAALSYRRPTQVQAATYQKILEGKSLFVRAETGSGKTMAYLMPLMERYKKVGRENKIVIVTPTHELAAQVYGQAVLLSQKSKIALRSVLMVGNANWDRQVEKLREKPQIIIGTAGRIEKLMEKRKIAAHLISTVVLDEGDKLLLEPFVEQTRVLLHRTLKDRQLLSFSASMTEEAVNNFKALANEPERIEIERKNQLPRQIKHWYVVTEKRKKLETLRGLVSAVRTKKAMIFINNAFDMEQVASKLQYHHYPITYIHGGLKKEERKKAIAAFYEGKARYLLSTDLAARGLDFGGIDTVFHVSIPENPLDYLHRAGRTGRNHAPGRNLLLVTKKEEELLKKYQKQLHIEISPMYYHHGKLTAGKKEPKDYEIN